MLNLGKDLLVNTKKKKKKKITFFLIKNKCPNNQVVFLGQSLPRKCNTQEHQIVGPSSSRISPHGLNQSNKTINKPAQPIINLPDSHRDIRAMENEIAYSKTTSCFKPLMCKYGGNEEEAIQSATISGGQGFEIKSKHNKLVRFLSPLFLLS